MQLKGSKTEQNLKDAFAGESQANRRYLYFAAKADVEGFNDVSAVFRSTAEGETGHAHGHLDYLAQVGDPASGLPIGDTEDNFKASIEGETYEYTQMYPGFAKTARDEGFAEIADWFETLARAEKSHAGRFQQGDRIAPVIAGRLPQRKAVEAPEARHIGRGNQRAADDIFLVPRELRPEGGFEIGVLAHRDRDRVRQRRRAGGHRVVERAQDVDVREL